MIHTAATQLAGILGWPVTHSRSPRLHGYWLRKYQIDGAYLPLPVHSRNFGAALHGLAAVGFRGVNVTVPHKQAAFALCDHIETSAQRAGAVNTIVFDDAAGIVGANSDGEGFLATLHDNGVDPCAGQVLILGAGGAARAIAAALSDRGGDVTVTSRRGADASGLASCLGGLSVVSWPAAAVLDRFSLLVNATSGGMSGGHELEFDLSRARSDLVVADVVYAPIETALLAQARMHGLRTIDGIGMLLHQAASGFLRWFGVLPEVDTSVRDFVLSD